MFYKFFLLPSLLRTPELYNPTPGTQFAAPDRKGTPEGSVRGFSGRKTGSNLQCYFWSLGRIRDKETKNKTHPFAKNTHAAQLHSTTKGMGSKCIRMSI